MMQQPGRAINQLLKRFKEVSHYFFTTKTILFIFSSCQFTLNAQLYEDYLGNGHNIGITVTSSVKGKGAEDVVSGPKVKPDLASASRFLSQATLGHNYNDIEYVQSTGIDAWIEEQLRLEYKAYSQALLQMKGTIKNLANSTNLNEEALHSYTFYTKVFNETDKLRQKMAQALLQIFVISKDVQIIKSKVYETATYYDILYNNAFGNYRDILKQVTLHPMMGLYLSHFGNRPGDYALNIYADENYAREIMQLFSIGLVKLNLDGTPKLDQNGNEISTYDNHVIREMAKVFTGLAGRERKDGTATTFQKGTYMANLAIPMKMYQEEHDVTPKKIINNILLPPGRSGMEDIEQTLDVLFNHPNVGPFIGMRLIQHFVKSNPSPAYVKRIATVFNDNGLGIRGDLAAVIKAILLDPEARDCQWTEDPRSGKLIQPIERLTKLFSALNIKTSSGNHFLDDAMVTGKLGQAFLSSPTVFNFFTPFYAEDKTVKPAGLVSPEFEIFNATTAIEYFNLIEEITRDAVFNQMPSSDLVNNQNSNETEGPKYDIKEEVKVLNTQGLSSLLQHLNILLCRGQLSTSVKDLIQKTLIQYQSNIEDYTHEDIIRDALFFIATSADYLIQN